MASLNAAPPQHAILSKSDSWLWHPDLHQEYARERLTFWRLGFFPAYKQAKIVEALERVLAALGVYSATIYELLGTYDILLRLWLPGDVDAQAELEITSALRGQGLRHCDVFWTTATLFHWPWRDPKVPPPAMVPCPRTDLDSQTIDSVERDEGEEIPGMAVRFSPTEGIKFFTVISTFTETASVAARESLRESLGFLIRDDRIPEFSLYEGIGFGQFLLAGRVAYDDYRLIRDPVVRHINQAGLGDQFGARPYTYLAADGGISYVRERMPKPAALAVEAKPPDQHLRELLAKGESRWFEAKATAFMNLKELLMTGKQRDDPGVQGAVLRTVVGMLNAGGGQILIGAAEPSTFRDPKLKASLDKMPHSEIGEFFVIGIEADLLGREPDRYRLRIQELLDSRISPRTTGLVDVDIISIDGHDVMLIHVRPAPSGWFYLEKKGDSPPEFPVRRDGRTVLLWGDEADRYKALANRLASYGDESR